MGLLICCLDDSEGARQALRVAREWGPRLGLELVLVHFEPPTEMPGVSAAPAGQERLHEEALLGSVSSEVAANAPCPCLIVPPQAAHP